MEVVQKEVVEVQEVLGHLEDLLVVLEAQVVEVEKTAALAALALEVLEVLLEVQKAA